MTDYLSHLAAKTLSAVDVLQPRVAAWFEPVTPGALSFMHADEIDQSDERDQVAKAPSPPVQRPAESLRLSSTEQQPTIEHVESATVPMIPPIPVPSSISLQQPVDPPGQPPMLREQPVLQLRPVVEPPLPTPVADEHIPTLPVPQPLQQPRAPRPPIPTPVQEAEAQQPASIQPPDMPIPAPRATPPKVTEASPLALPKSGAELQPPGPPAPIVAPLPRVALPMPPIAQRVEQPAPTIRVTIGRIDVRAITPPAPAPRTPPASAKPALSLDDYLKQREGGL